jgi:hypothetical protein
MDAKDLMIGDIVSVTPSSMLIRIAAIHRKKVAYHACNNSFSWVRVGLLQPIPLTPEILEKNGFEQKQSKFINGDIEIIFTIKGFSFWSKKTIEIAHGSGSKINNLPCYVHQLQHALRICGINKEIEI